MKSTRATVPTRPPDAALGRQTRGLVGPAGRRSGVPARAALGRLRRPTRIVTATRAAGLLGMLACGFAFTFVTGPTAFALTRTDLPSLTWTDPAVVRATLALPAGTNVFRLDTTPLEAALRGLPAVATADVSVGLPDAVVVVQIEERQPVLAWQVGDTRYMADRGGTIFATTSTAAALPAGVVVVVDGRGGEEPPQVGGLVDAVDFDVATRLGSVTPADIGSAATSLRVAITDLDGFVLSSNGGWTAVFGFYSPATRSTDMIAGQVRLLKSLLYGREPDLLRIILASATDGTYVPKATPKATVR
ncbi:MAG: FtsQ-type POTRA domain-containing protein [Chloroflexi bacterium]|nr:FtsQ-type POTRA domain-containing protein [Chloroflexota bacterium]